MSKEPIPFQTALVSAGEVLQKQYENQKVKKVYIQVFEKPLQDEKLVKEIDATNMSLEENYAKRTELYGSDYPMDKYQIVVTGKLVKC
ncbi:hypothetical protein [Penaeicola halotolerans]|uniref:hypothetical protein n=1 Tax=Penaeicola halotolerans TaxID=2793196 RepID=UPI001CF858AF|nr:hypothetical protein [Penaeicola halotolerans]